MYIDKITPAEAVLVDNVVNKINIYMQRNNQTLYNLASNFGFAYQPFYKLVTKRGLPNLSSLATLADCLGYTIDELVGDKVIVKIKIYNSLQDASKFCNPGSAKIYLSAAKYTSVLHDDFFAIVERSNIPGVGLGKIYTLVDKFDIDSQYLAIYQDQAAILNVTGVSSKFVLAEEGDKEIKITLENLKPIGKLFDNAIIYDDQVNYIYGTRV